MDIERTFAAVKRGLLVDRSIGLDVRCASAANIKFMAHQAYSVLHIECHGHRNGMDLEHDDFSLRCVVQLSVPDDICIRT